MKTNQKLIIIDGLINGGKTLVFNLLKHEDDFIFLDISMPHFELCYKMDFLHQIGEENTEKILKHMKTTKIFLPYPFLMHIGSLMKKFPEYNFVIKPGYHQIAIKHYNKDEEFKRQFKKLMPIKYENLHNLYVVRHPKMAWITQNMHRITIKDFIAIWSKNSIIDNLYAYDVIKIEEINKHKLLNSLIKKTDLNKVKSYTNFDLQVKRVNLTKKKGGFGLDYLLENFKSLEDDLMPLFEALKYDINDKNILSYISDDLDEITEMVDWGSK